MTKWRLLAGALLALNLQPAASAAPASPDAVDDALMHGHALLIGNYRYRGGWNSLDDIPLELRSLRTGLDPHFDTVDVSENLTGDETFNLLRRFFSQYGNTRNGRLLVYYAGHGYSEPDSDRNQYRGFITGVDTPLVRPGDEASFDAARPRAVSMDMIRSLVADASVRHVLFIFDSCFAGTIFGARGAAEPAPRPYSRAEVAELLAKPVRDFITAGGADERVPAHSPLPQLLLNALAGGADYTRTGIVTGQEIGIYISSYARQLPDLQITPHEGKLLDPAFAQGEFLFRVVNPAPVAAKNRPIGLNANFPAAGQGQADLAHVGSGPFIGSGDRSGQGNLPPTATSRVYQMRREDIDPTGRITQQQEEMDQLNQIIDKYNKTASGIIDSMR